MRLPSFGRVDLSRRSVTLAVGDAVAIAAFVAAGELRHAGTLSSGLQTYAEFLLGWSVAAIVLGAYAEDAIDSWSRGAAIGLVSWIGGAVVGQLVRAVVQPGFYVAPSFVAVSIVFGGLAVVTWRVLAAVAVRPSRHRGPGR